MIKANIVASFCRKRLMQAAVSIIISLLFFSYPSFAQQDTEIELAKKYAEFGFREKDYDFALENYLKLYELDKKDININFRIGVCYTETNKDKTGGISYLEYVVSHNNFPREALYYLGKAYMFNYQFTEAVEALYEYKIYGIDREILASTERLIDMAYNAREYINQPKPVRFELLDTAVNSIMNDFRPLVTSDGKKLFFTSNRRYVDELATNVNDIYMSESSRDSWGKARMLEISTFDHEEVVGIAPNGDMLMIFCDGYYSSKTIKMATRKGKKYELVSQDRLPADLNSPAFEHGACINTEGTMIIFASDRLGGYGGMDLYKIEKKDRRTWGSAQNLGSQVNTPFDENFPTLSYDGRKLHFSSNAHSSIGGMDLFYSTYNAADSSFQRPLNHGFPISTPFDDISISFNADESIAYVATTRNEGIGNLDIYKVHVGKESTKTIIIAGLVMIGDENSSVPYEMDFVKVYATVYDKQGNLFSKYDLDESGQFFITLYPGEYILDVRFDKATTGYREKITLVESEDDEPIFKTVYIKPLQ